MIDTIGDLALNILKYLDFDSLEAATKVSRTWQDEILRHRDLLFQCHQEVLDDFRLKLKLISTWMFWPELAQVALLHGLLNTIR